MAADMPPSVPQKTLLHVFSTLAVGGPQIRLAQIVSHFGRRYRHLLLAMDGRHEALSLLPADADFRLLEPGFDKGDTLGNLRRFRRLLHRQDPDLLITYNWGAIEWGLANLVKIRPHIHLEDGFGPEEASAQIPRRVWFRRLALLRTDAVVLPSRTLYAIAADIWKLPPRRLVYLPNGIDCARFAAAPDPLPELATLPGTVIGTVATLRAEKNISRLLRAVAVLRGRHDISLVIGGGGPELEALEKQAEELGIRDIARFTGHCDRPERLLAALDIFALSSDTEQMPYSVLEAMAAGLPVAATAVGDVPHMLSPANRELVCRCDDVDFTAALEALIADPARRAALGAANRDRAFARFDQAAMFRGYERLYDGHFYSAAP